MCVKHPKPIHRCWLLIRTSLQLVSQLNIITNLSDSNFPAYDLTKPLPKLPQLTASPDNDTLKLSLELVHPNSEFCTTYDPINRPSLISKGQYRVRVKKFLHAIPVLRLSYLSAFDYLWVVNTDGLCHRDMIRVRMPFTGDMKHCENGKPEDGGVNRQYLVVKKDASGCQNLHTSSTDALQDRETAVAESPRLLW